MNHSKYFHALAIACLMLVGTAANLRAQTAPTVRQVAKLLICPCPDCGKQALDQCPDKCHDGKEHRDEIAGLLAQNKSQDEILKYFSTTYGAYMLGDPPREGFALYASWVPYGVAILGLLPLFLMARSRRPRGPQESSAKTKARSNKNKSAASVEDPRLAAALKEFDY